MRWKSGRRSANIEDRRGSGRARPAMMGGGLGAVAFVIIALLMGADPGDILNMFVEQGVAPMERSIPADQASQGAPTDELGDFMSVVLADTEDVWGALFESGGARYREPKLVLFSGAINSACGFAQAAMGPFYCPGDEKVYIDLSFFRELRERYGAPGDFAQAYVLAHEVGHHVQNLLGVLPKANAAMARMSKRDANQLLVRLELQADCYAGLWAHHADRSRDILEQGDVDEALNAASAIGDDRLQKQSQGYVTPDSFTHGTSAQRQRWFRTGMEYGSYEMCDTFSAESL